MVKFSEIKDKLLKHELVIDTTHNADSRFRVDRIRFITKIGLENVEYFSFLNRKQDVTYEKYPTKLFEDAMKSSVTVRPPTRKEIDMYRKAELGIVQVNKTF